MASYHLDGEALIWFQDVEQAEGFLGWETFVKALQYDLELQHMMIQ